MTKQSHYETLGVPSDATPADIKGAYRRKASDTHPDKGGSEDAFKAVGEAFTVLSNAETRQAYDTFGDAGVQGESIESMAASALQQMFDKALDDGGNLVAIISRQNSESRANMLTVRGMKLDDRARLIKRAYKVKTKDGAPNLFQQLIDGKVKRIDHDIAEIDTALLVSARIGVLLQAYTDAEPEKPRRQTSTLEEFIQSDIKAAFARRHGFPQGTMP